MTCITLPSLFIQVKYKVKLMGPDGEIKLCYSTHTDLALDLLRFMEIGSCCKPLAEHYNPIIDSLCKDKMVDQVLELFAKMIEKGASVPIALKILLKIQALILSMMSLWSQLSPQRYSQSSEVVKWFLREVAPKAGVELPKADDDEAPKNVDPIGEEYVLKDCDSPPIKEEWHSDLKADTYMDFLMVTNWVKHNRLLVNLFDALTHMIL
ncbi:putative tetratricopeptide-like helical domain-containing protein [Tanacetum coccineum]